MQVNRALKGFDCLESISNLAAVDEDAAEYNVEMHKRIFVAEEVENILQLDQEPLPSMSQPPILNQDCEHPLTPC